MLDRINKEFNLESDWELEGTYCSKNNQLFTQFIEPHAGTNWKYCLRAEYPETFDRWGVALFEEEFEYSEFDEVLNKLRLFVKNKEENIKNELEYWKNLVGDTDE